jgi:aminomethyltransferase
MRTPLYDLHVRLGARMVPFAGYEMPVQYAGGILAEHRHTRTRASLFDVSHMGQGAITGPDAPVALEALVPGDIAGLAEGRTRYTQLTGESGGIVDDLMVTRLADRLILVVNAATKAGDFAHIAAALGPGYALEPWPDRALLAVQGPAAAAVAARFAPGVEAQAFMTVAEREFAGRPALISRSGYSGEDGFEISLAAADAEAVAETLLDQPEIAPAGLGARDTLRLEAGLCLYGQDIDEATTPVEAGLAWSIGRRRRETGGFPGAEVILRQIAEGTDRKRVGLRLDGRAPARAGAEIMARARDANKGGAIGKVTSGGFGPTVGEPIAMGYVKSEFAADGTEVDIVVRGKPLPAHVSALPFVPHRYFKGG